MMVPASPAGSAAGEPAGALRYSGAGLGLSIVAGIVSAHQGTVSVENVDGGCRFSLLLPAEGYTGKKGPLPACPAGMAPPAVRSRRFEERH